MFSRNSAVSAALGLLRVQITNRCFFHNEIGLFLQQTQKPSGALKNAPKQVIALRYRSTTPLNTIIMFVPQQEVKSLCFNQMLHVIAF